MERWEDWYKLFEIIAEDLQYEEEEIENAVRMLKKYCSNNEAFKTALKKWEEE